MLRLELLSIFSRLGTFIMFGVNISNKQLVVAIKKKQKRLLFMEP